MRTFLVQCLCGKKFELRTVVGQNRQYKVRRTCPVCKRECWYYLPRGNSLNLIKAKETVR